MPSLTCGACGFVSPPGMGFCGRCGARLTAKPETAETSEAWDLNKGDRRQLTVVFCDLVDSTTLASLLDAEDLHEVIREYQEVCSRIVETLRGYVAQYLGDGLLIYFGYPTVLEDSARRAVVAGLEMAQAVARLGEKRKLAGDFRLAVRIGIHTGPVVTAEIGSGESRETLAVGSTPNVAARLQNLAAPGAVLISAATWNLVGDYFACRPLGPQSLKGVPQPVEVYETLGESGGVDLLETKIRRGLDPIFGRQEELELLRRCFERAQEGRGQLVQVQGEAGVGKSRLVQQIGQELARRRHTWWSCVGSAYHQTSAFYPLIDLVLRWIGSSVEDPPESIRGQVEKSVERLGLPLDEAVPAICSLLSIPAGEGYRAPGLHPLQVKERVLQTLLSWMLKAAEASPLVLAVEDLHWIDPSTLEFLDRLLDSLAGARILVLQTFRPELTAPRLAGENVHIIRLERVNAEEAALIAKRVAGKARKPLSPAMLDQIVETAGGIPLFVEELTKAVLAAGAAGDLDDTQPRLSLPVPATLQDSLMSRLDRLDAAKEAAQLAAVLGRSFSFEVLAAVAPWKRSVVEDLLRQLLEAELLVAEKGAPQVLYSYRHPLLQEAAYASILKRPRRKLHARIAGVLESQFAAIAEAQPELVAHHYTQAGSTQPAISAWQRAGLKAVRRSANVEASRHLEMALSLLADLPETPERDHLELTLRTALGPPLTALHGFSAPEVATTFRRAYELCRKIESAPQLFPILLGLCRFHTMGGSLETALEIADRLLELAIELDEVDKLVEAYRSLGSVRFFLGDVEAAKSLCETGLEIERQKRGSLRTLGSVYQPGLGCRSFGSWSLWILGYPDQALAMSLEGLEIARQAGQPYDLAQALSSASLVRLLRRDCVEARALAAEQIALASEHHLAIPLAGAKFVYGASLVEEGLAEAGLSWVREGSAAWWATGAQSNLDIGYGLAKAWGGAHDPGAGLQVVDEMLAKVESRGERFFESALYQLKAELLAAGAGADRAAVEALLEKALSVARRQGARSLELRAAVSLGRLWAGTAKQREAQELLAGLLAGFTEGRNTADLVEAEALLRDLGKVRSRGEAAVYV